MATTKKSKALTEQEVWKNIDRLTRLCESFGWTVEYDMAPKVRNRGLADSDKRTITLNASQTTENIYYVFIHEIGHMVGRLWTFGWDKKYDVLYHSERRNSATYKIARIQDEIEAWDYGLKFARDHKFRVNTTKYEKIRAECLTAYMMWATKRRRNAKWNKLRENLVTDDDIT